MDKLFRYALLAVTVLFLLGSPLEAQNNTRIERLQASLVDASTEEQVKIYNDLGFQYRTVDSKKTIEYCQTAITLAEGIGFRAELPRSYNFIGLALYNDSQYHEALEYFDIGTAKALEVGDSTELGFSYQSKAGVYRWLGDLPSALSNAFEAEAIFRMINDASGLIYVYGTLAGLYLDQNEPEKALEYTNKAFAIREKEGIEKGFPTLLLAHADVFAYQKKYSEAYQFYHDALNQYQIIGHQRGMLITNIRMAIMYNENGDYKAAKAKLAKARNIHEKFDINTELTSLYMLEGILYLADDEPRKASRQLKKAKAFALETNRRKELSEIYRYLAIAYEARRDPGSSLYYLKIHHTLKDSLFNESVAKTVAKYESDIAFAKQKEEFKELQLEKAKSDEKLNMLSRLRIGLGLIALLLMCIILVIYRSYRIKKKSNDLLKIKNEKINRQSEILQQQAKELKKAQNILKESNEKLEEKVKNRTAELSRSNADLERFAFIASHDMKEPLRTITSFSQLLRREIENGKINKEKVKDYLEYITSGTRNMNLLVQDLLTYSKLKDSPEEPFTILSFDNVINAVLKNLDNQIRSNDVELYFKNLPSAVYGIEVMLVQLFQNLLSNAIKFRKEEGPCIIELKAKEEEGKWTFSISDNGIGIDRQYHNKIFELFRKLHSRMNYEGSGIGLSICKRIVELHNGDIWLESEVGEGTTFYFSIPKGESQKEELAAVIEGDSEY